ncbi:MAG: hypothetical protein KTR24_01415 [Saprospiraceae bacterium]|nr:hypothetical protein [Saprospiraceae bacterium]
MRPVSYLPLIILLLTFSTFACLQSQANHQPKYKIPIVTHDLSYIPFDPLLDDPNFQICDSTKISSGRNRLQYAAGRNTLRSDIVSRFSPQSAYESFNGYIVIRFLANCKGQTGRYRAASLHLDFSPAQAPSNLEQHAKEVVMGLNNWSRATETNANAEYSKFINLKIKNGKIDHVVL